MKVEMHRLDADYTCRMLSPILALAGGLPDAIKAAYRAYTSRYPTVTVDSFRGLDSQTLAGVGMHINLLGGQVQVEIKVDQITVQARNLTTEGQVKFAQDAAVIAHDIARSVQPDSETGEGTLKIRTWNAVAGGQPIADKILATAGTPSRPFFSMTPSLSNITVLHTPQVDIVNNETGWRLIVHMERSALESAHLFILRDYMFTADGKCTSFDDRISVIENTTKAITDWLGLEI
jgi:hypothetical protein